MVFLFDESVYGIDYPFFNSRIYYENIYFRSSGKHTGEMIKDEMELSFSNWDLDKDRLAMMLRDSGSNMVKACKDWGINHFPCIGHSLHLVVGPFFLIPKSQRHRATKENEEEEHEADHDNPGAFVEEEDAEDAAVDEDVLPDSFNSFYATESIILEACLIVQGMQKFCNFVKKSTKGTEKLEALQKQLSDGSAGHTLKVKMDVRTQWNSTLAMINQMIQLMQPINDFLAFYKSLADKKEFKGNTTKLPDITPEKWAILQGLLYMLTGFE
jgi:hypothetical protein